MHDLLLVSVVSMIVGAALGWVSEKIAVVLAARPIPQRA
jgi:predicted lysophospholipase L1 biosynthesis ABC-type transport system permease subunit